MREREGGDFEQSKEDIINLIHYLHIKHRCHWFYLFFAKYRLTYSMNQLGVFKYF